MKAQPKGAAPVSRDVVEGVKRKMAAPAGPPPSAMLNFNAPRGVSARGGSSQQASHQDDRRRDYDDGYNDRGNEYGYREGDDEEYYSDEYTAEDTSRRRDEDDDGRDYRYNGGNDDRYVDNRSGSNNYSGYNAARERNYRDDDGAMDGRDDPRANIKPRPVADGSATALNASAQSKQYSAGGLGAPVAETGGTKQESLVAPEARRESGPTGPATAVVSAYLVKSRTNLLSYQSVLRATYRELKYFVTAPCPPGVTARCYIERNRSGSKMLAPYYSICADLDDGTGRELMVCRKVMRSRTPHYIFSLKAEDLWRKREQRSRLYLGKLRATGAQDYVLYDNGICEAPEEPESLLQDRERESGSADPSMTADSRDNAVSRKMARDRKAAQGEGAGAGTADEVSLYRSELLAVHFNCKARPAPNGKRGTEVCIPNNFTVDTSGTTNVLGKPVQPASSGLLTTAALADHKAPSVIGVSKSGALYNIVKPFDKVREADRQNDMYAKSAFVLHERTSKYDPLSSCLVDFKGRANMASVKNCQFVVSEPASADEAGAEAQMRADAEKDFVLQLGKTTEDCFNMDYRYPLSLLQAFAICIARFDAKLAW